MEELVLANKTTPSRILNGLDLYRKNGVIKYRIVHEKIVGLVEGSAGAIHRVEISSEGYKCTCAGNRFGPKYLCKHAIALLMKAYSDETSFITNLVYKLVGFSSSSKIHREEKLIKTVPAKKAEIIVLSKKQYLR